MESRSFDGRTSELGKVVTDKPIVTRIDEPKTTRIVLQRNIGTMIVRGNVTGTEYRFYGAGYQLDVANEDLEDLLSKKRGGCCGSVASPYFVLV